MMPAPLTAGEAACDGRTQAGAKRGNHGANRAASVLAAGFRSLLRFMACVARPLRPTSARSNSVQSPAHAQKSDRVAFAIDAGVARHAANIVIT
jgi:hypothetical protein